VFQNKVINYWDVTCVARHIFVIYAARIQKHGIATIICTLYSVPFNSARFDLYSNYATYIDVITSLYRVLWVTAFWRPLSHTSKHGVWNIYTSSQYVQSTVMCRLMYALINCRTDESVDNFNKTKQTHILSFDKTKHIQSSLWLRFVFHSVVDYIINLVSWTIPLRQGCNCKWQAKSPNITRRQLLWCCDKNEHFLRKLTKPSVCLILFHIYTYCYVSVTLCYLNMWLYVKV